MIRSWVFYVGLVVSTPVLAGPVTMETQVESGFTSNAADSPVGQPDSFLRRSMAVTLAGSGEGLELRGSLGLSAVSFQKQDFEDDQTVSLDLAMGRALSERWTLRGSFSLGGQQQGDDLDLGGVFVAIKTPSLTHQESVELAYRDKRQALRFYLAAEARWYGDTAFPGNPLRPVRLTARSQEIGAGFAGRWALGPDWVMTVDVALRHVLVPEADQSAYGRLPFDMVQVGLGAEWRVAPSLMLAGSAGAARLWSADMAGLEKTVPVWSAAAQWALAEPALLSLAAGHEVDPMDARDGLATERDRVEAKLGLALDPDTGFALAWSRTVEQGLYLPGSMAVEQVASIGLQRRLNPILTASLTLDVTDHRELGAAYRKTQWALRLAAAI